jgi:hypothetical protein
MDIQEALSGSPELADVLARTTSHLANSEERMRASAALSSHDIGIRLRTAAAIAKSRALIAEINSKLR